MLMSLLEYCRCSSQNLHVTSWLVTRDTVRIVCKLFWLVSNNAVTDNGAQCMTCISLALYVNAVSEYV